MTKRYVFWRQPTGTPYKGKDEKYAPTATLADLGKITSVASGKLSYKLPRLPHKDQLVLRSAVVVLDPDGNELNESDTWAIFNEAIHLVIREEGGGKPLCPNKIICSANKIAAAFFRRPVNEYVCVTTLSVESLPKEPIEIGTCKVSALDSRGDKYALPKRFNDYTVDKRFEIHFRSSKYKPVKVTTNGRSVFEAMDNALDVLNLLRGLWTLCEKLGSWSLHFGIKFYRPIGVIHIGPIHTIHNPDGSLAIDNYWYEPDYTGDQPIFEPDKGWEEIDKFRLWALENINNQPYRRDLERLIIRYAIALSHANPNTAFLQLWSILERITDTVGAKYDDTIKRIAWPYKDRLLAKEYLGHLRFRRNQYVHLAAQNDEMDQTAYLAKSFIEQHLLRLIRNDFGVESLSEYGKFLSLPTNTDTLEKRQKHLDHAIKLLNKET